MERNQLPNLADVVRNIAAKVPKEALQRHVRMSFALVMELVGFVISGNICVLAFALHHEIFIFCRCKCVGCSNKQSSKGEGPSSGVKAGHDGKHIQEHRSGGEYLESEGIKARPHSWTQGTV